MNTADLERIYGIVDPNKELKPLSVDQMPWLLKTENDHSVNYIFDSAGGRVFVGGVKELKEFIVKCVNVHDKLIKENARLNEEVNRLNSLLVYHKEIIEDTELELYNRKLFIDGL